MYFEVDILVVASVVNVFMCFVLRSTPLSCHWDESFKVRAVLSKVPFDTGLTHCGRLATVLALTSSPDRFRIHRIVKAASHHTLQTLGEIRRRKK